MKRGGVFNGNLAKPMPSPPNTIDLAPKSKSETMEKLCNLPRLSPIATRLLAVSNDPDSALEEFDLIFAADSALAVELLRVANSARFGLQAEVSSLKFALMLLGVEGTRNLAFTIALSNYARLGLPKAQAQPLWMHSIATAVIAEEIGNCIARGIPDFYTAGLTHDLGRLGLLHAEGLRYSQILGKTFHSMDEANSLETILFGMTHADAGAYLAKTWGLPVSLCNSIRSHHSVLTEADPKMLRINQQACIMASALGYPELPNCPTPDADTVFAAELRDHRALDPERLKTLILRRANAV